MSSTTCTINTLYCKSQIHNNRVSTTLKVVKYYGDIKIFFQFCFVMIMSVLPTCLCVFVSSPAVRTKSSSLGLSDWASAAHQPSVWPPGHPGSSLDGETWVWKAQILRSSRKRCRLLTSNTLHSLYPEVFSKPRESKWFKKNWCVRVDLLSLDQSKTFYKPDWFDIVGEEVKCCKEAVCVIDMSSFTKFELTVSHGPLWTTYSG